MYYTVIHQYLILEYMYWFLAVYQRLET